MGKPDTTRSSAICAAHNTKHGRGNATDIKTNQRKVRELHGSECIYCGTDISGTVTFSTGHTRSALELDRIAGSCIYSLVNLLPSCGSCNTRRNHADIWAVALDHEKLAIALRKNLLVTSKSAHADNVYSEIRRILASRPNHVDSALLAHENRKLAAQSY